MVDRPRTPQALTTRAPTTKEAEYWKQRIAREEQAAGLNQPASPTGTGQAGSLTLGTANRSCPPWHPWLEGAATRYEQGPLGPTQPRHGAGPTAQPPPCLMALPFGSHDKAVERAYSRYGHLTRDQHLRSPTRTAPCSPTRAPSGAAGAAVAAALAQASSLNAIHTLSRPSALQGATAGGALGYPLLSTTYNTGNNTMTGSLSSPASPRHHYPPHAASPNPAHVSGTGTGGSPLLLYTSYTGNTGGGASAAGSGAAAAAALGPAHVAVPNGDTYHGLTRTVKRMPSPPPRAMPYTGLPHPATSSSYGQQHGSLSRPVSPARRRPSPERLMLAQKVHKTERELQRERETTKALRAALRAATYKSVPGSAATLHYTYPTSI